MSRSDRDKPLKAWKVKSFGGWSIVAAASRSQARYRTAKEIAYAYQCQISFGGIRVKRLPHFDGWAAGIERPDFYRGDQDRIDAECTMRGKQ